DFISSRNIGRQALIIYTLKAGHGAAQVNYRLANRHSYSMTLAALMGYDHETNLYYHLQRGAFDC
ncbi:hypothetical protein, partial [Aeromonas sp. R9-1]|uniref:hypothetical protein n=1 Tax=Aeromonas sp. R9-1 TaxID=3138478 RepID=UPI0034A2BE9A